MKELKEIRSYFYKHDKTIFEHKAYKIMDDLIKEIEKLPTRQQIMDDLIKELKNNQPYNSTSNIDNKPQTSSDWNEIEIGNTTHMWKASEHYTKILDEEGESMIELRWPASEGEVRAALYSYYDGRKMGESIGKYRLRGELKKLLDIK
jgi:hypothetical protein